MNRRKIGWEGRDRICLAQDRDGSWAVIEPSGFHKVLGIS